MASQGFHVSKETTYLNALECNLKLIVHDPYSYVIKEKHEYFTGSKLVGHIPREISRYVIFFIKQKGNRIYGKLNL